MGKFIISCRQVAENFTLEEVSWICLALVVAQLAERLLSIPEVCGFQFTFGQIFKMNIFTVNS